MDTSDLTTKRCSKCGEVKPRDQFGKRKSQCKACDAEYARQYRRANPDKVRDCNRAYREQHLDELRERSRQNTKKWAAEHPEYSRQYYAKTRDARLAHAHQYYENNSEARKEYSRKWYAKNQELRREYSRQYRRANPEATQEYNRHWRANNLAAERLHAHRRAARKRALLDNFTSADWQIAIDYFGGCCAVCGHPAGLWHTLAADHWIPLSKGGPTTPDNIVPLCHSTKDGQGGCNNSKKDKMPADWLIDKFGKRKGRAILRRIETYLNSRKQ